MRRPAAEAARQHWEAFPCGATEELDRLGRESLEFFDALRRQRYEEADPWMLREIPWEIARGKRLLEVGHGIGSDLLTWAEHGAQVHGIDLSEEHHRLARRNFELHGRECRLALGDCHDIDYPDRSFGVVYSHGVLHHTDDTEGCVREIARVLEPGGVFVLTLYHTWSWFHLGHMLRGVLLGRFLRLGYRGVMATLEGGADGRRYKPLVKTYGRREVRRMLRANGFEPRSMRIAHLKRSQFRFLAPLVSDRLLAWLEPRIGWYVVAVAIRG